MKGDLKLKYYNFNQEFHPYQKQDFVEVSNYHQRSINNLYEVKIYVL